MSAVDSLSCPLIHSIVFWIIFRNLVRDSRQKQLQSGDEDVQFIGKPSADFEFGHLTQNVSIAECSAKDKQLTSVTKWIKSII